MNDIDKALLQCLRGEVWDSNIYAKQLVDAAYSQAVAGLVAQRIVDSGTEISHKDKLYCIAAILQTEKQSQLLDKATVALAQLLDCHDIHYAVMKGQVVATRYATPLLRQSGDVDFYVAKDDFERAAAIIENSWNVDIEHVENDHHWSFTYKGVSFEMHYRCELFGIKKHQFFFDRLIEQDVIVGNYAVVINGIPVKTLSPELEIAYVFKHLYNHLLVEGVGLKQVLDLKCLLECQGKYDIHRTKEILRKMGYHRAFDAMLTLLSDYIGITCLSDRPCGFHKAASMMMAEIMKNGNFGRKTYRNHSTGWRKSAETSCRALRHVFTIGRLAPMEVLGLIPLRIGISMRKFF